MPESQKHAISMSCLFANKDNRCGPPLFFFSFPFLFFFKISPNKLHMGYSDSSSCQYFVGHLILSYGRCTFKPCWRRASQETEQYRMAVAAKIGCYCLENKLRMCGQMVLMVEAYTQLESSEFLKNIWVWWYFSLRTKVVESNFIKYCPWSFIMFQLNRVMNGKSLFYKLFCPKCILSM